MALLSKKYANDDEVNESDEDYDFKELEDAAVEEAEDRIYTEYKRCQEDGTRMEESIM